MRDDDLLRTRATMCRDTASVSLEGELDIATTPLVGDAVARAIAARPHRLDLDVAGLTFCDAAGVRALLQARRVCRVHHAEFRLIGIQPRFQRVLALLRVAELLPAPPAPSPSPAAALSSEPL
ncbi:STAS domain-containing protein [Streptomyces sp. CBMA123]|uniref:STAS domain-containing protein n=1 Tax=Streptomyces sp. CBMA123 TaxID=1896313 RepID=UPI001661CE4C|nr:STAS domain-containing protein [Streptomyces sp. CBMA123]